MAYCFELKHARNELCLVCFPKGLSLRENKSLIFHLFCKENGVFSPASQRKSQIFFSIFLPAIPIEQR